MSHARSIAIVALAAGARCLVPAARRAVASPARTIVRRDVSYLSEVEDADSKKKWWEDQEGKNYKELGDGPSDPRAPSGFGESDDNYGPKDYVGFVDAEGFDGGDGQVGVVGDGKNHMEEFDMDAEASAGIKGGRKLNQLGGSESKLNAKNAWGQTTGYADDLKKRGMVEYDEYGEDKLQRRRQQLENWRNQQELRLKKDSSMAELASLQGKEYKPVDHGSYLKQFDAKPVDVAAAAREATDVGPLKAGDVLDTFTIGARLNARGGHTLTIQNEYSLYSDFEAGFLPGASDALSVEPTSGTLNRRGSDPQDFVIKFQPQNFEDSYEATLVIQTEDSSWTYDVVGKLQ